MTQSSVVRGVLAMVAGAGLLTLSDAVSKHLAHSYPVGQVICLRQLAAFVFILPYVMSVTGFGALRIVDRPGQLLRALLFVAGSWLIVWSLSLLPISIVTVVLFSSPIFVALFSMPVLGERVDGRQWLAIAGGFVGVTLIVRPAGGFSWIVFLPIVATLFNSLRDAFTRRLSNTENSVSILFWSGAAVALAGLFTLPFGWRPLHWEAVAWFLAAGLFNAVAHFMVIEALRLGRAAVVVPFRYTGILWAMLVGFIVWNEVPDIGMLAGAVIVVVSGVYMIRIVAPGP